MSETGRLTSELMWRATSTTVLIDVVLLLLVARFVSAELFAKLKWHVAAAACVVYALLWGVFASVLFWDAVYSAVFPDWSRWLLPVGYGLLFGALALAFWHVSIHAPRWQVWFCLLGGGMSLVGHGIGIARGLLRVPLLADASVISVLSFGVAEFIVYWCVIVGLGVASRRLRLALHARPD